MAIIPPMVELVAKQLARLSGVAGAYICHHGAIDVVLEAVADPAMKEHVVNIGSRAMLPVHVFRYTADNKIVHEGRRRTDEGLDDFYTNIHVAGFAGSDNSAASNVVHKMYGDKDAGDGPDVRDDQGQLKLTRLRSDSRGRQVTGWQYGKHAIRIGDNLKFKEPCVLQWTMGRTVNVDAGMMGRVSQVASKSPMAYLTIGDQNGIEVPVHAAGHVYDVMANTAVESSGSRSDINSADMADMIVPNSARRSEEPKVIVKGKQKTVLLGRKAVS